MNELAVSIAIILFPGLVAAVLCEKIIIHEKKWDAIKYGMYSFLFGVSSYVLLQVVVDVFSLMFQSVFECGAPATLKVWSIVTKQKPEIKMTEVAWATVLSPIVAGVAALLVNNKLITKIYGKFKVTTKYGDENLYSYFLNSKEVDWVYLRDKESGLTYRGQVVSFSECEKMQEILLSSVTVYESDTSQEVYRAPVIYLSKPLGVFIIELALATEELDDEENSN